MNEIRSLSSESVAPAWRRSCHANGQCTEVAAILGAVAVRDSKHPTAPHLNLSPGLFGAVLNHLKEN